MFIYLSLLDTDDEKCKFEQLYNRYRFTMMHTAYSILHDHGLAEDAVHDAFLRIAKNLNKIGTVDSLQTKGFVVITVKNVALTIARRRSGTYITDDDIAFSRVADSSSYDAFSKISFENIVQQIIALPDIYREVLYLRFVNEMQIKDIASVLSLPVETVKKRVQRGRKILADNLQKEGLVYE